MKDFATIPKINYNKYDQRSLQLENTNFTESKAGRRRRAAISYCVFVSSTVNSK